MSKPDLPTVSLIPISASSTNNTIKNESDINQGNACKDTMSNNMDHHVDNANSYHSLKDTDDVIFISNESN